jgi:C4-dicarboxylate-specific signal transduction histidine kinase
MSIFSGLFRNLPIQRKLAVVIQLTCAAALAVTAVAIFFVQLTQFRQNFTSDMAATGQMLANHATGAVTFKDRASAEEILLALKTKPAIFYATVTLPDGTVFAKFDPRQFQNPPAIPRQDGFHFLGPFLLLNQPILIGRGRIGTLHLVADYEAEHRESLQAYASMLACVLLVSILLSLLVSDRLQRLISAPILSLAGSAQRVAEQKDYSVRAPKLAEDEVGRLTDAFNEMLGTIQTSDAALREANKELESEVEEHARAQAKLEALHKQLMAASRQAGMAEVATGVLHNVGNVLNSVNVSITLIQEQLERSEVSSLAKAAGLLESHASEMATYLAEDPKGKLLPSFIIQLSKQLEEEHRRMTKEHAELVRNLDHIKEIVTMQQSYATVSGVLEKVALPSLVDDALRFHAGALERHGVTVERQYDQVPPINIDKHKALQILVNLVHNAKYALDEAHVKDKKLTVGIAPQGAYRVKVTVADNGVGIAAENLNRIFSHGFTTRKGGHGFGLHSGANAAREMGGFLSAASDGMGKGAVFTLELPVIQQKGAG